MTRNVWTSSLNPTTRHHALTAMAAKPLDVLVIGGGVTGTGAALDAATRGLTVGLVERHDYACGTSSRSSKLIHGGVRYLEMLDFGLVREALQERGLMLTKLAPHLVRPVPIMYPLKGRAWERPYIGAGLTLYDTMGLGAGSRRGVPMHKHLSHDGAMEHFPSLNPEALVGAVHFYDGQVDDARHTLAVARTAAEFGAHLANRVTATGYLTDGNDVVGATLHDDLHGRTYDVRARAVINATGVWGGGLPWPEGTDGVTVKASKGVHILVDRDALDGDVGLILRTEKSVLFVLPWGAHWLIGTTDTPYDGDVANPTATAEDISYILDTLGEVLTTPLTPDQVVASFAGLRPLVDTGEAETTKVSREHVVKTVAPGLVTVAGGKYTTYRVMAKDAVDEAVSSWSDVAESCTEEVALIGAHGWEAMQNCAIRLAAEHSVDVTNVERLIGRYGSETPQVLALITEDESLRASIDGASGYLAAEVAYAALHEGAVDVDDVLHRRTRIAIETPHGGARSAAHVRRILDDYLPG